MGYNLGRRPSPPPIQIGQIDHVRLYAADATAFALCRDPDIVFRTAAVRVRPATFCSKGREVASMRQERLQHLIIHASAERHDFRSSHLGRDAAPIVGHNAKIAVDTMPRPNAHIPTLTPRCRTNSFSLEPEMPRIFDNPQHLRDLANEARSFAKRITTGWSPPGGPLNAADTKSRIDRPGLVNSDINLRKISPMPAQAAGT